MHRLATHFKYQLWHNITKEKHDTVLHKDDRCLSTMRDTAEKIGWGKGKFTFYVGGRSASYYNLQCEDATAFTQQECPRMPRPETKLVFFTPAGQDTL